MDKKINRFKKNFTAIIDLCSQIEGEIFYGAISSLNQDMEDLQTDADVNTALTLLDELTIHLDDLNEEVSEVYGETIEDVRVMIRELMDKMN